MDKRLVLVSQPYSNESWRGSDKQQVGNDKALSGTLARVDRDKEGTQAEARAISYTSEE
jgi:hypothetical protein